MKDERAEKVLNILCKIFPIPKWTKEKRSPFETLILTIISQNTADRNTARDFARLSRRFEIKPDVLLKAETNHIEDALKTAGLYRSKTKTIKQVSKILIENFQGSVQAILSLPFEKARKMYQENRL